MTTPTTSSGGEGLDSLQDAEITDCVRMKVKLAMTTIILRLEKVYDGNSDTNLRRFRPDRPDRDPLPCTRRCPRRCRNHLDRKVLKTVTLETTFDAGASFARNTL